MVNIGPGDGGGPDPGGRNRRGRRGRRRGRGKPPAPPRRDQERQQPPAVNLTENPTIIEAAGAQSGTDAVFSLPAIHYHRSTDTYPHQVAQTEGQQGNGGQG